MGLGLLVRLGPTLKLSDFRAGIVVPSSEIRVGVGTEGWEEQVWSMLKRLADPWVKTFWWASWVRGMQGEGVCYQRGGMAYTWRVEVL